MPADLVQNAAARKKPRPSDHASPFAENRPQVYVMRTDTEDKSVNQSSKVTGSNMTNRPSSGEPDRDDPAYVHIPSFSDDEDDDSWSTIVSTRPAAKRAWFFVGNLELDTTEENISAFITSRAEKVGVDVKIHYCRIFKKEKTFSARIAVNSKAGKFVRR